MFQRLVRTAFILLALPLVPPLAAIAEDLDAIFKRVKDLTAGQNFPKALEELAWAKKEVETMHAKKLQSFFPDELAGFKGQKVESNSALGLMSVERKYQGAKGTVEISLSGGSGAAGMPGLGNLAQLGKMAAMMGGTPNQEMVRIGGKAAAIDKERGGTSLTVFLDSGSLLKVEGRSGIDLETLKELAEAMNLNELDTYLKG